MIKVTVDLELLKTIIGYARRGDMYVGHIITEHLTIILKLQVPIQRLQLLD
jgi:hypothetical protein